MTTCTRLWEKGLLDRRPVTSDDRRKHGWRAYLYEPRMSEAEFTRAAVEQRIAPMLARYPALVQRQIAGTPPPSRSDNCDRAGVEHLLAYVATLRDAAGERADDVALDMIVALLERAETAERLVVDKDREIRHMEKHVETAERRAEVAEHHSQWLEQQLEVARRRLNLPPKPRKKSVPAGSFQEYCDEAGICRVCGKPAPPPIASRQDSLRVCGELSCRTEARRRDCSAKQQRYHANQRALKHAGITASAPERAL
jgi:hypothetical protein